MIDPEGPGHGMRAGNDNWMNALLSLENLLLWLVVGVCLLGGIVFVGGYALMALEGYRETPKTAFLYTICIAVLFFGLVALGASWEGAAVFSMFFGCLLAMWLTDWLGVKDDE